MIDPTAFPSQKHFPAFNFPESRYNLICLLICTLCDTGSRWFFSTPWQYKEGLCNSVILLPAPLLAWTQESVSIKIL